MACEISQCGFMENMLILGFQDLGSGFLLVIFRKQPSLLEVKLLKKEVNWKDKIGLLESEPAVFIFNSVRYHQYANDTQLQIILNV